MPPYITSWPACTESDPVLRGAAVALAALIAVAVLLELWDRAYWWWQDREARG